MPSPTQEAARRARRSRPAKPPRRQDPDVEAGRRPPQADRGRTRRTRRDGRGPGRRADGAGGRRYDLVIVESPAKAKTINKYLGPRLPGAGQLRPRPRPADTAASKGEEVAGIDIADGWKLRYVVDDGSKAKRRKGRAARQRGHPRRARSARPTKANRVLPGHRPRPRGRGDRLAHRRRAEPRRRTSTFRIGSTRSPRTAVQQALASRRARSTWTASRPRRPAAALDRVVGFPLSNLLGKKVARGSSAGRVQSVAVQLIVDREREIEAFKPEEYWKITALLAPQGTGVAWHADPKKSKIFAKKKAGPKPTSRRGREPTRRAGGARPSAAEAPPPEPRRPACRRRPRGVPGRTGRSGTATKSELPKPRRDAGRRSIAALLDTACRTSSRRSSRRTGRTGRRRRSPPARCSSRRASGCASRASRTMQTAQKLYEGVELGGEGQVALITYMRTDSTRVSNDALTAVRDHIQAALRRAVPAGQAERLRLGQERPGGPRGDPPDRRDHHPAAGRSSWAWRGDQLRLYTLI